MNDTIYALSSGQPPAAIAVVRVSGPDSLVALETLAGAKPQPRRAHLVELADRGDPLDRALVIWFEAPNTATGDDLVEFHLHGGRAVVAGVEAALSRIPGLRAAEPGEFTRRAFDNGRIDLAEAEGLADLLSAETQSQRRAALRLAGGSLSRQVLAWTERLLALAAVIEARLDFSDEGDVGEGLPLSWEEERSRLAGEVSALLARPPAERLRDGIRVVIAGPPNVGKSTLLNALAGWEAAITSAAPGTTRDLIDAPVSLGGVPFVLTDSAGLRESEDSVEAIGVARAQSALASADLVLWLGEPVAKPRRPGVLTVASRADLVGASPDADLSVSAVTGEGMAALSERLVAESRGLLPNEREVSANARQRAALSEAFDHLASAAANDDLLIVAEELRRARLALDRVTGRAGVEDMLDALFGRFCIGK
ncbi:MAG TPA: tRNA uridine-5-carboxymethylaminomethyl(34) synthesis GTPase MnmE [Allosphingosinicella sp.]|jgi:tRNA modification GTPase